MKTNVLILSATNIVSGAEIVLKPYLDNNDTYDFHLYTSSEESIKEFYSSFKGLKSLHTDRYMTNYLLREHPYRVFKYLISLAVTLKRALKIMKAHDIKVVYGNNGNDLGLLVCLKLIKGKHIRTISHIHNQVSPSSVTGLFVRFFGGMMTTYIVPSKATKASLIPLLRKNVPIKVVYNGVALSTEDYLEHFGFKIAFVGGISQRKRPDLYLDLIQAFHDSCESYRGVILGPILEEDLGVAIKNRIEVEGLKVDLLRPLPHGEMDSFYKTLDCLVLTSDADPLPTVLIEGLNNGVIVAARDVGGVKEIIEDDVDGIIFPYEFDAYEVADRIMKCLKDKETRKRYQIAGREKVKSKFSNEGKRRLVDAIIKASSQ